MVFMSTEPKASREHDADEPFDTEVEQAWNQELSRRADDALASPDEGAPWTEIYASLVDRLRRKRSA